MYHIPVVQSFTLYNINININNNNNHYYHSYSRRRRSHSRRCTYTMTSSSTSTSASSLLLSQKISSTTTSMKQKKKHPTNYKFVDIGANLLDERYTDGIYYGKKRHESDFEQVIQRSVEYGVTHLILTAGTLHECKEAIRVVREYRNKWSQNNSRSSENNDNDDRNQTQPPPPLFLGCTVGIHPTRCQQEFIDNLITDDDDDDGIGDGDRSRNSKCSNNKDHDQIQTTTTRTTTATDVLEELYVLAKDGVTDGCVVAIGEIGLDYDRLEFTSKSIQISKEAQYSIF